MADDKGALAEQFGALLREERARLGISQEALALEANVDRTFVSKIERGKNQPALTTLFLLARVLKIPASELVLKLERRMSRKSTR